MINLGDVDEGKEEVMQRYDWTPKFMGSLSTGMYVLYSDHLDEIAALKERIKELEGALTAIISLRRNALYESCPDCSGSCDHGESYDKIIKAAKQALKDTP